MNVELAASVYIMKEQTLTNPFLHVITSFTSQTRGSVDMMITHPVQANPMHGYSKCPWTVVHDYAALERRPDYSLSLREVRGKVQGMTGVKTKHLVLNYTPNQRLFKPSCIQPSDLPMSYLSLNPSWQNGFG